MLSVSYQLPTSYADSNSCTKKKERNRRTCQHSHVERSEYPNSVMRHRDGYRLLKHEKRIQSSMWKAHKMRKINQNLVSPIRVLQPYESCDLNSLAEEDSSQIVQTKRLKDRSFLLDRITFLSLNMHDDVSSGKKKHKSLCWLASLSLEDTGVSKGQILDWIYMVQDIAFALVKFKKDVGLSDLEIQTIFDLFKSFVMFVVPL
uniref:VEFS-Box domain-containing protein n=1 Tax=Heterorhabditis bacteriophora TaxID=37862 RepID=A0A1I7XE31_HETBA